MSGSKEFLTTQEFAQKAGVSANTVSKWIRTDKIKGQKKNGKWIIPTDEISKIASPKADHHKRHTPAKGDQPADQASGTKSYTIKEFSDMTYLTEFGVTKWLKEGRLRAVEDGSGQPKVDSSNLENPYVKRLIR